MGRQANLALVLHAQPSPYVRTQAGVPWASRTGFFSGAVPGRLLSAPLALRLLEVGLAAGSRAEGPAAQALGFSPTLAVAG